MISKKALEWYIAWLKMVVDGYRWCNGAVQNVPTVTPRQPALFRLVSCSPLSYGSLTLLVPHPRFSSLLSFR